MDNFSAYEASVEQNPPLQNIHIVWLPANSTSIYQPLDQGIINSLKAHYRRHWLEYMITEFENLRDPLKLMQVHLALWWIIRAWHHDVSKTTIRNCFIKSTILPKPREGSSTELLLSSPTSVIQDLYTYVQEVGNIHDTIDISTFINPDDEAICNTEDTKTNNEVLDNIVA